MILSSIYKCSKCFRQQITPFCSNWGRIYIKEPIYNIFCSYHKSLGQLSIVGITRGNWLKAFINIPEVLCFNFHILPKSLVYKLRISLNFIYSSHCWCLSSTLSIYNVRSLIKHCICGCINI